MTKPALSPAERCVCGHTRQLHDKLESEAANTAVDCPADQVQAAEISALRAAFKKAEEERDDFKAKWYAWAADIDGRHAAEAKLRRAEEEKTCQKCESGAATARSLCDKCFSAGMEFGHAHPEYTPEKKP